MRKVEKIRHVIRKPYIHSEALRRTMEPQYKSELERRGIHVREHWLGEPGDGAYTGELQTIILVLVSGIAGGLLSAIGGDIWSKLKSYLQKRYRELETDRQKKASTRHRVRTVYIVCQPKEVPIIYYAIPSDGEVDLDFDQDWLAQAEADIQMLIRAGKVRKNRFMGIHLKNLGKKPFFRRFEQIPSGETILKDMTMDMEKVEAWTHAIVAGEFEMIERLNDARRHYEIAIQGEPKHAGLRKNLGIIYARKGNLSEARKHWEAAAEIDKQFDVLHYNIACFHASQGNIEAATKELQLAVDHGFRDVGMLTHDAEFTRIINSPEICEIIEKIRALLQQ